MLIVAATIAFLTRPPATAGPFARDFEAYYSAGATRNAGGDPYGRDIWQVERTIPGVDASHDELLPFVGPPAGLPLWSALARLPFGVARALWEALLVASAAALVGASLVLARAPRTPAYLATACALALLSGPVISAIALGQAALLGAGATIVAFVALERRSPGAWIAACVAALQPNLALPLAVRAFDRRSLATLALAAAAFVLAGIATGTSIAAYVALLRAHGAAERFIAIQQTVPAIVASFGVPHDVAALAGTCVSIGAFALAAWLGYRLRVQPAAAAGVAVALLPFAVPFFHEHDFAIVFFPIAFALAHERASIRALGASAAVAVLVDWLGVAQRPAAAVQTASLAIAVAAAAALLALRTDEPRARQRALAIGPLGATLLLCALALPLAHAFPAPTWPDALGAYRAPPGLGIAAIWAAENRRAGLDAVVPAWGVLRAIPLAGCALVAFACARARAYAMNTAPSRIASATAVSDSPMHGPSVQ